jgi:hypothetical protein
MKNKYVKRIIRVIAALVILYAIVFPGLERDNDVVRMWFLFYYMIIWIWVLEILND